LEQQAMPIGPAIRRLLGRHERRITDLYRAIYFDVDSFVDQVHAWAPDARSILEIGCGDGGITQRLASRYPDARLLGTDIAATPGHLYAGPTDRVSFERLSAAEIAARHEGRFDLVLFTDVLHHIPISEREGVLAAASAALSPGGALIVKEWERTGSPIYWLGYASDRWITGDRINYATVAELRSLVLRAMPRSRITGQARLRPWRTNVALLVR
jgi:2-polyprenyl-6-hydroxyphenyl methylase/3-demethylubiquinone-9 3-methyltransferase